MDSEIMEVEINNDSKNFDLNDNADLINVDDLIEDVGTVPPEQMGENDSNIVVHSNAIEKVKKPAPSTWVAFLNMKRYEITKNNPSFGITDVMKTAADMFKAISPEEKNQIEKERLIEVAKYKIYLDLTKSEREENSTNLTNKSIGALSLPLARIKKTIKMDPDIKAVGKEATVAIAKATELFIVYLARKSSQASTKRGLKTTFDTDVIQTIHSNEELSFLRMDFPRKPPVVKSKPLTSTNNNNKTTTITNESDKSKSIKSYFTSSIINSSIVGNNSITEHV
eukprot:gene10343-13895_t